MNRVFVAPQLAPGKPRPRSIGKSLSWHPSPCYKPAVQAKSRLAFVVLLTGAVGIAFAPVFVRLSEVGPSATAFYRLLLALPVLWLWRIHERTRPGATPNPASSKEHLQLAVAGLLFAGDLALWHWSIKLTSVANAPLFANFAPIFV